MKRVNLKLIINVRVLIVLLTSITGGQSIFAQSWYDLNWGKRLPIAIANPQGIVTLSDFQVKITLTSVNEDFFLNVKEDESDIRVTSNDGVTLIPFWVEYLNPTGQSATIWVKVPLIPVGGTTIFLYYDNDAPASPPAIETPPIGPFTRAEEPIEASAYLLAENIVYDNATGRFWVPCSNYNGSYGVGLLWSYTPTNPYSWTWYGNVFTQANGGSFAPHIIYEDGLWYIFFAQLPNIVYMTSANISGPYSAPTTILSPSELWEAARVDEPYVFKRNDGKWILIYMGDSGGNTEQIGYASSDYIYGPYEKYASNPCIQFGPPSSYDAGTIADPWVYEYHNVYYIGYTAGSTNQEPWITACATTSDWVEFTKIGVIFPEADSGWDSFNSFRGAITRVDSTYLLSYVSGIGGVFYSGVAKQPVYSGLFNIINNPLSVFDFYDDFNGPTVDYYKWNIAFGNPYQTTTENGSLKLTAINSSSYIILEGRTKFGLGYVVETRSRNPNKYVVGTIGESGFEQTTSNPWIGVRIFDNEFNTDYWSLIAESENRTTANYLAQNTDPDWHIFRVYRQNSNTAGYQVDDNTIEKISTNVPTIDLPPYLMSYTFGVANDFYVDWTRVRKWAGSDPVTVVGIEQDGSINHWTGLVNSDWNTSGNWSSGVPGPEDNVAILFDAVNDPEVIGSANCNNLTIEPTASLTVATGGTLTVGGLLTINSIGVANSGSLIVIGSLTTGTPDPVTVTYNRYMPSGSAWHYVSTPVDLSLNTPPSGSFYAWDEVAGDWSPGTIALPSSGVGYTLRTTGNSIAFTGSLVTADVNIEATSPYKYNDFIDGKEPNYGNRDFVQSTDNSHSGSVTRSLTNYGGGGWNLLGNPYTSAISVSSFINANYSVTPSLCQFDPNYVALYLYNGSSYYWVSNSTGWLNGTELDQDYIQAGQGFFVLAMNDNSTFTLARSMQEHSTSAVLLKSAGTNERWPGFQLRARSGKNENLTTVVFGEDMTTGLDPGFDVGMMNSSPGAVIYTALVEDNGVNFARQVLPVDGSVKNTIPIGVDFENGGEVTFSADVEPLRAYKFILEDRVTGIFTDISTGSYTITLPAKTYGTGRFFVLVSTGRNQRQKTEYPNLLSLRIWSSLNNQVNIQGSVSESATCQVFDIRGHKIFETHLSDSDYNTFNIPSALKGVYLIKVTDAIKTVTQKVVFL